MAQDRVIGDQTMYVRLCWFL